MASLIKRALSEAVVGDNTTVVGDNITVVGCNNTVAEDNIKLATRQPPGNLYVCYSDWNVGGPFIIAGVILFIVHKLVVHRIFLGLGKDRQLFEHSYFRTSTGFWTGLLLLSSYTLITLGIYQYSFIGGIIFNFLFMMPFFYWLVHWLRKDFEKEKIVGDLVEVNVEDYYMDFKNTSKVSVTLSSAIQFLLLGIMTASLFEAYGFKGPPFCTSTILFYAMGMVIQFLYLYHHMIWSLLDKENFWSNIISKNQDCIFVCLSNTNSEKGHWKRITRFDIKYRQNLHFFVNGLIMLWVLVLIPIQIAAAEQLQDIVLNMVATYFITELDDLNRDECMVVSTNPDRFVKTPGTWNFYTWHPHQETAAEVRKTSKSMRAGRGLQFSHVSYDTTPVDEPPRPHFRQEDPDMFESKERPNLEPNMRLSKLSIDLGRNTESLTDPPTDPPIKINIRSNETMDETEQLPVESESQDRSLETNSSTEWC